MLLAVAWDLHTLFVGCAVIGGVGLAIQMLLMLLGGDSDGDFSEFAADEIGAGGSPFFAYLSLKAVTAFVMFFGLTAWWAEESAFAPWAQIAIGLGAGLTAFYLVAFVMASMKRLESKGNVDLNDTVGKTAQVYLRVPARKSGMGKVTVAVHRRSVELNAVTEGDQLETGVPVRVVSLLGNDTVEVAPV